MFSVEEYKLGLHSIRRRMNPKHFEMLQAQYAAPNRTVTAPQLAEAIGYSSYGGVNLHYGKLGRLLAEELGKSPPPSNGKIFWFEALSSCIFAKNHYLWTMYPALATALEEMSIVRRGETLLPEEINPSEVFVEGAARKITVNAYERNAEARSRCIACHGFKCFICSFDFGVSYGELLEGFIHVHHLRPLSEIDGEYEVDPIEDLRPVCPNCHAVIHRRKPPFSIDEVKAMLAQAGETP